jgi:hypothetical protein
MKHRCVVFIIVIFTIAFSHTSVQQCQDVQSSQIGFTNETVDTVQRQFWGVWGIVDDFAIITARRASGGILLANVSDYTNPSIIPSSDAFAPLNRPDNVFEMQNRQYMLVAVQVPTGSIVTVNISSPIIDNLSTVSTSTFATSRLFDIWVDPSDQFAAVASHGGEGLIMANVSNPIAITLISQSNNSFDARNVECRDYFDGTQLFCAIASFNERQVYLYNATNVESAPVVSTIMTDAQLQTNRPMGALFHPILDIVYVYSWSNMIIQAVNVSDPTSHIIGGFATGAGNRPNRPSRPIIIGTDYRILIFISYNSFMNFYCLDDPMNPTLINSIFLDYGVSVAAPYIIPGDTTPIFIPKNRASAASPDILYIRNVTLFDDADVVVNAANQCSNGTCCNITSGLYESNTTMCDSAANVCREESLCTGASNVCPPNPKKDNGIICGSVQLKNNAKCINVEQCINGECLSRSRGNNNKCAQ